jgi:hypothetical protein
MQPTKPRDISLPVSDLRVRIEQWRATRTKRTEMPEDLWAEAARLTRAFGINQIAKTLRLDYYSLKARAEDLPGDPIPPAVRPAFVEIDAPQSLLTASCIIDAEHGGEKLTIRVSGSSPVDVLPLLHAFWSRGR